MDIHYIAPLKEMDIHYVAPTSPHRSGSHQKEMDIHYVAPQSGPEASSKRTTSTTSPLTPRPPPPFDFGQSDRVRETDPEIAPKFAVPGPLLRS